MRVGVGRERNTSPKKNALGTSFGKKNENEERRQVGKTAPDRQRGRKYQQQMRKMKRTGGFQG